MLNLSVIIITKNEAGCIRRCLESVKWADEIIVYDNNSQDETVAICKEYTSHIFITEDWPGFGMQKNRALSKASFDWVLSLDADEWLDEAGQAEVQALLKTQPPKDGYYFYRANYFCGKIIRYGDWGQDKILRLFNRSAGKMTEDIVHECVRVNGKIGFLKNPVFHDSFENLHDAINKMNRYTSLTAETRQARGKRSSVLRALAASAWVFSRSYLFRLGFLDGRLGFVHATYLAENSFYRHVKTL
jgi:glycosyltransferase involved in cell wall biosynthesis